MVHKGSLTQNSQVNGNPTDGQTSVNSITLKLNRRRLAVTYSHPIGALSLSFARAAFIVGTHSFKQVW